MGVVAAGLGLGKLLGSGGSDGQTAVGKTRTPEALTNLNKRTNLMGMPGVSDLLGEYGSGKKSLSEVMEAAKGLRHDPNKARRDAIQQQIRDLKASRSHDTSSDHFRKTDEMIKNLEQEAVGLGDNLEAVDTQGLSDLLATDSRTAGTFAKEQLMKDDFYRGGLDSFNRGLEDEKKLGGYADEDRLAMSGKDPSYGLTEGDYAAYGQGSGNIARLFGQEEQSLAQSLADRGLAAAPSGVGVAGFSGLHGNKMERLGQLQTDIAQKRIDTARDQINKRAQMNLDRLDSTRSHVRDLGQQGLDARDRQMGRQAEARKYNDDSLAETTRLDQDQQVIDQDAENERFAQRQATKKRTIGETLGDAAVGGLASSVGAVTGAPGKLINSLAGGGGGMTRLPPGGKLPIG